MMLLNEAAMTTEKPVHSPRKRLFSAERGQAQARSTIRGVLALVLLAYTLGGSAVWLYLRFLFPINPESDPDLEALNFVVFGIYLGVVFLVSVPINALLLRRAVVWVRQGVSPTERQRKLLFNLPTVETGLAFVFWCGAAIIFSVINTSISRTGIAIALAGVVTCTLLYLLLEAHLRPVYALALQDATLPRDRRDVLPRLFLPWLLGSAVPLIALGLSPVITQAPPDDGRIAWVAGVSVVAGGLVMTAAARSVSRPLDRVQHALRQIDQGNYDVNIPLDDLGELGRLAEGVNQLVAGIKEREQLRNVFAQQVGQQGLVDLALANSEPTRTGERREVTVLFVDLRGYTSFAEHRPPEDVVAMLNVFFRVVVTVVSRYGGWVNKFEGDAALCLFGAPQDQPDHTERALKVAMALPRELENVDVELAAGIGVATGEVIAGFVGSHERFEYTVIGDVVNLASRLCDAAKTSPSGVLVADSTITAARKLESAQESGPAVGSDWPGLETWIEVGPTVIRGRDRPVTLYTLSQPRRGKWYATPWTSRTERKAP